MKKRSKKYLDNKYIYQKYFLFLFRHPSIKKHFDFIAYFYYCILVIKYILFRKNKNEIFYPERDSTKHISLEQFEELIQKYDVISFDVFDTLLFRTLEKPIDVFTIVGARTNIVDFSRLRIWAELDARTLAGKIFSEKEVTIFEIYDQLRMIDEETRKHVFDIEFAVEKAICYPNPYVKEMVEIALRNNKVLIATSDMYYPHEYLNDLLSRKGFDCFKEIFVSCDYRCSKRTGKLFEKISEKYPDKRILHIGDDIEADCVSTISIENVDSLYYRNVNFEGSDYRPKTNSIANSVYNGLVNAYLHNGVKPKNPQYEFGFVYGGILSYGYCQFIDSLVKQKEKAKVLFTARDSEIFYKLFLKHFHSAECDYLYCSREALLKACYPFAKDLFFESIFVSKISLENKQNISDILKKIELDFLTNYFEDYGLTSESVVSWDTIYEIEKMLLEHEGEIVNAYKETHDACLDYLRRMCADAKNIFIVDLGWRGTVYYLLDHLIKGILPESIVSGVEIGSTRGSNFPITLIDTKRLLPYAFSHSLNNDLQIKDEHVMLVEMLFSSECPGTIGYKFENGVGTPVFGISENPDTTIFKDFKNGMIDFAEQYDLALFNLEIPVSISGRDAFLPLYNVCDNYDYIISIFKDLNAKDMSASDAASMLSLLDRFGYKKN